MRPNEELYLQRLWRVVRPHLPSSGRLLDAGCGEGKIAAWLQGAGYTVIGIDVEAHPQAWQDHGQKGIEFRQASAEALPFGDASFDVVLLKDALHHMQDPQRALHEAQRVAKPGAAVVVFEPNRYNPWFYLHLTLLGGHQHFTRRQFRRMLLAADPQCRLQMAESRCLPWDAAWILKLLRRVEDGLEAMPCLRPWLTYQIGVIEGKGR